MSGPSSATPVTIVRESKKWTSRIWLSIVNFLIIVISAFAIFIGAVMIRYGNTAANDGEVSTATSAGKASFDLQVKDIAIAIIVYGCFMLITGLAGFCGAITRNNGLLTFYIGALILDFLLVAAGGSYSIYTINRRIKSWKEVDVDTWTSATKNDKDLAQWVFGCCGFEQGDDLAYVGEPLYAAEGDTNKCKADASLYPGCKAAGGTYWGNQLKFYAIAFAVSVVIILISIGAAYQARRMHMVEAAYVVVPDQQPLMKQG